MIRLFLLVPFLLAASPIQILPPTTVPPAGLPTLPGISNIEVFHASPPGYTYNHHPDLACWQRRLYLAWDSGQKDEDVWPSHEVYSTSTDGHHWTPPVELFPQGTSTSLRMYFYHASHGHMLAIAGLRTSPDTAAESKKAGLVVREIHLDHTLGPIFTLQSPNPLPPPTPSPSILGEGRGEGPASQPPPLYTTSPDQPFITACHELLSNTPFLEQQDFGLLLPPNRRMKWHTLSNWPSPPPDFDRFGKAMCFFHRADSTLVCVMKWGWVTTSNDDGKTWSLPTRPPTLITGMAKVFASPTPTGQYILVYNPHPTNRFPLVLVHSPDGITFGDMHTLQSNSSPLRYPGLNKVPGPQYPRGLTEFSDDHSWPDLSTFIAYSLNKEDIYITLIPASSLQNTPNP